MAYDTISVSAPRIGRVSGKSHGRLDGLSVDFLQNGYTVTCRHHDTHRKGGGFIYTEPVRYAFGDRREAITFIADKMGVELHREHQRTAKRKK